MSQDLAEKMAGEIVLSAEPGKTLRKWRDAFNISQNELAQALGRSPSIISDYEKGRRRSPGIRTLRRIVGAILEIDRRRGGPVLKRFSKMGPAEAIFAIQEYPIGIAASRFIKTIEGKVVACSDRADRDIYGYTVLDSLKAITSLSAFDYLRVYGWTSERAIIFTGVRYGRSPMVAIRSHPMKPAIVVFHRPERIDELAVRLAEIERIPLVTTGLHMDVLIDRLKSL
ncbi:MAG: helix-turn-helix domain-containing protein [Euryarchaeota archaeon]|nr:helix-turn-helix domain-containing protein [Euryarchaeota archaeon]